MAERIPLGGGLAACRPHMQVLVEREGRSGRSQHASLASVNEDKGLKKNMMKKKSKGNDIYLPFFYTKFKSEINWVLFTNPKSH